jgi:Domain of unknown function (DUF6265)
MIAGVALALNLIAAAAQPAPAMMVQRPLDASETEGQARLSRLAWLAGTWRVHPRPMWTNEEMWMLPLRGSMLGMAREVFDQRTRSFEFMRIAVDRDGSLGLYASPNGAPAVRFAVVQADADGLVAENGAHDYPQRITYRRSGNVLTASISMLDGSRAESWTYQSVGAAGP